jgi:hypothetical protein
MRRLMVAGATLALLGAGLFIPALANPASGPTDALTGGTVTIVVGRDPANGLGAWTTTVSGQFAAGGRTYSGTATGLSDEDYPYGEFLYFAGTSATGTIGASCLAKQLTQPTFTPVGPFTADCSVSIDGAPVAGLQLVLALAPTADPSTFSGVFGAAPDTAGVPTFPALSFGTASASTFEYQSSNIGFGFQGQIDIGGGVYHGVASGGTDNHPDEFVGGPYISEVPSFALIGTSLTETLNATCSGEFVAENPPGTSSLTVPTGVGLSILSCSGSANGGPAGNVTLVSIYPVGSGWVQQLKGMSANYSGAFVGI